MVTMSRLSIACGVVGGILLLQNVGALANPGTSNGDGCRTDYLIGAEDVLDIAVWENAALTRTVPVRPDGKISLPLLDDVQAAGLTPMQLRERLVSGLGEYISAPAVSVVVREVHSFKVAVLGQVKAPGRYEIKDRATVLDVLAIAGGITEFAARGRIVLIRTEGAAPRQIPVPYDRLTKGASASAHSAPGNFCVSPGDVIVVP
jgi:polysaccharide biosynthesis/export protein